MASLRHERFDISTIEASESPQLRVLRPQHCGVWTIEISETSTLCVETGQMSSVETGQMSAVESGQMSAVETGQMSSDGTRQMFSVARTDIRLVSTHNVEVSEISTRPISQCSSLRSLNCGNVTMFKSQIVGLALPKLAKMGRNGSRIVARS